MPLGSRGSLSSIARRRYRLTPEASHRRPPARSYLVWPSPCAFSGDVKNEPSLAQRPALRTSAPSPFRQAKQAHPTSTSCANRKPANASPRADALNQQHVRQAPSSPPQSDPHAKFRVGDKQLEVQATLAAFFDLLQSARKPLDAMLRHHVVVKQVEPVLIQRTLILRITKKHGA